MLHTSAWKPRVGCIIPQCTASLAPGQAGNRHTFTRTAVATIDGPTELVCGDILTMMWAVRDVRRDSMMCDGGCVVWRGMGVVGQDWRLGTFVSINMF